MNYKAVAITVLAMALAGCASTTPTVEREQAYAIYRVVPAESTSPAQISQAVQTALQRNMSQVQVSRNLPPSPLPETAPRFQVSNPFSGSGFAALAAQGGANLQVASCEGSLMSAMGHDSSMSDYGESTQFTACLWQYQGGYHVDVHTSFTRQSGGFSPGALGASLARSVVGDSSQFIPRTIGDIVAELEKTGASVELVESYP